MKLFAVLSAVLLLLAGSTCLYAMEYTLEPSLLVRETYDDNANFQGESDFETLISPAVMAKADSERTHVTLSADWDFRFYSRDEDLNRTVQRYSASIGRSMTERWNASLRGLAMFDETYEYALEEQGEVADLRSRATYKITPGTSYVITERNSLGLSYTYTKIDYDGGEDGDREQHGGSATWTYQYSERTSYFLTLSGNRSYTVRDEGDVEQKSYQAMLGASHSLSEVLSFSLSGGAGRSFTTAEGASEDEGEETTTYLVDTKLNWTFETMTAALGYNRDFEVDLEGQSSVRDRFFGNMNKELTERFSAGLGASIQRNKSDGEVEEKESEVYSLSGNVKYDVWENAQLGAGYEWREINNKVSGNVEISNRIYVEFGIAFPQKY